MRIAIISASSDIGRALARHWALQGNSVVGTFRTRSGETLALENDGVPLVQCDLGDVASIDRACARIAELLGKWDALVVCPGTLEPIGEFATVDFGAWATSVDQNFLAQMRCMHALLPHRSRENPLGACVISWAGGGTNSAPKAYSAYTVSKFALIKMMELLDSEVPDVRFVALGPGWVRTKIHQETLRAGPRAGKSYELTANKLGRPEGAGWTEMSTILACCDWVLSAPRRVVGGRNVSVAHDSWEDPSLAAVLEAEPDMYKLRRYGNNWRRPSEH